MGEPFEGPPIRRRAEPLVGGSASLSLAVGAGDISKNDRPVAQLAEQRIPNPQVGGSIPSWPATFD